MGHKHHLEHLDHRKVRFIGLVSFVFGFVDAFFSYVVSSYFAEVIGSDNVGGFYLATFGAVMLLLWNLHRAIRRIGGSIRAFLFFLVLAVAASAAASTVPIDWVGAAAVVALLMLVNLAWVTLDVILEEHSEDGVTGRVRGLHLTIMNAGFLLAPFFSTHVVGRYGFEGIFSGMTLGLSILLALSMLFLRNGRGYQSAKMEVRVAWKKMLREHDLLRIFHVSFGLEFFYVIMVVYTPIHLRSIGIPWDDIGFIFTVMLLPFVFLQYPLGLLADKRFGEKEFLVGSIVIAASATLAMGFHSSSDVLVWAMILLISRIGAAGMEVLRDSYFYKQIDGGDDDLIAFFRMARPLANVVAAAIAIPFLVILPLQGVFFLVTVVLFLTLVSALRIEDTAPSGR